MGQPWLVLSKQKDTPFFMNLKAIYTLYGISPEKKFTTKIANVMIYFDYEKIKTLY